MSEMPKFNFSNSTIKSDEELDALSTSKASKFFRPGKHEVVIDTVEYGGPAKDPTWMKLLITLKGAGEKEIKDMLMVPTQDLAYTSAGGKKTNLPFKKLQTFLGSLGVELTASTVQTVLTKYLSQPTKTLKGKNVAVNIGYDRAHEKYVGKDDSGDTILHIEMADGAILLGNDGQPVKFTSREALRAYAEQRNLDIQPFPNVRAYERSATPATATAADANW